MAVYYNEFSKQKAAWLRNLIEEGAVAPGVVDERSIHEVQPDDLRGFTQCHFFAGIGLWSLCLRNAGWPDDRPVWTGSCPCGPFSIAGKQEGFNDPRHLWPEWFRLIGECGPHVIFGEQSDQALAWLDLVQGDLEGRGYAIGSVDIPAGGFGGAHERQRLGFVADANNAEWWSDRAPWHDGGWPKTGRVQSYGHLGDGGEGGRVGDANRSVSAANGGDAGEVSDVQKGQRPEQRAALLGGAGAAGILGDPRFAGLSDAQLGAVRRPWRGEEGRATVEPSDPLWAGVDWLFCRDSRWRPIEPLSREVVDARAVDLVRVRRGRAEAIEKAVIDAIRTTDHTCPREAMLDLWRAYSQASVQGGAPAGAIGIREAQVLLSFLRQLARQGWPIAERIQRESEKTERSGVRGVRDEEASPCPSCGRGLDEQRPEQYPDLVRLLSPVLAQHAQEARAETEHPNAASVSPAGMPLVGDGDPARMLRLKGYGDAIDVEAFTNLIAAYMEESPRLTAGV